MAILKHIDFEVPGFGEFASPPTTGALTQAVGTSPPHLPGQTVLRIDTAGDSGVLTHDLGAPIGALHTRLMLNASQVGGGSIVLGVGFDAGGLPVWLLTLDAVAQTISLGVGATQCSADLPDALDWHTIELNLDAVAGSIALWLNGIERSTASTTHNPTRTAWLGIALTMGAIAGPLEIDHWALADAPLGVPLASPHADHAGDPRRWLVVYNRDDADSAAWADAYRNRRGVPYANLCGLSLSASETISPSEYQAMRQQIADYLDDNHLAAQVVGLLLGHGVPGYADLGALSAPTPIANYLHTHDTHGSIVVNPLHSDPIATRPNPAAMSGIRLTGRVDAPDLAGALALMNRADILVNQPLAHDQSSDLLIDLTPNSPDIGPAYLQQVSDWANGQGRARLRLPATIYDAAPPPSASGEAVVWGWRDTAPPSDFFQSPAGRRAVCQQFAPDAQPATTVRNASATDWLNTAIRAGYAAAAAPSRTYSLSALPLPHLFFDALRLGWTLAEAWLLAKPFLRDGLQLIGDPLMTVGFPRAGFDVLGPADHLDAIDLDHPTAILHAGQHTLQLDQSEAPSAAGSCYIIRRYDEQGRPDATAASVFATIVDGAVIRPALPAWPAFEGWRIREANDQINLTAVWPASLVSLGIDRVALYSQSGTDDPALLDQHTPRHGQRRVVFTIDRPAEQTRYRLRILQGPAGFDTPWSAYIDTPPAPDASLTLLETQG